MKLKKKDFPSTYGKILWTCLFSKTFSTMAPGVGVGSFLPNDDGGSDW